LSKTQTGQDRRVPRGTSQAPSAGSSRLRTRVYPHRPCRLCRASCPRSVQPWTARPELWLHAPLSRAESSQEGRRSLGADATRQTRRCQRQ